MPHTTRTASAPDALDELRHRFGVIKDLEQAASLLSWDKSVYMPEGASEARGQQLATLALLRHERLTDPALRTVLDDLDEDALRASDQDEDAALVREARRTVDKATKLPADLVEALSKHTARAHSVWVRARRDANFALFAPELERMLELRRREADELGFDDHPYDALHDRYEPGSTAARLRRLFGPLRERTVALLRDIRERGREIDDAVLHQPFDEAAQERFALRVIGDFGYDFSRGRLDRTVHPFAQSMSKYDVRITTRYQPDFLNPALFGTLHEAGHAMYEQGIADGYQRTPLGDDASLGVHESQSRLWENLVGRSRAFWEGYYETLQQHFPEQLGEVPLDEFHAAINRVAPSLIRVEADEVTYNLHVMIRFELELALLEGSLAVADLPEAWNARYAELLGVTPPDDARGVLQDIHWAIGLVGYFPTYALGNLMSVQLWEAASAAIPELEAHIRAGEFGPLLGWLRDNVHRHGSRYEPEELLERATGQRLDAAPYVRYLDRKYRALYRLDG